MKSSDYFSRELISSGLKKKTVRGGLWTAGAQAATVLVALAVVPILSRLLDPEDFGLLAMVAVFTNFARMLVDSGLSMATVQRDEITHEQVSNLFWIAATLGAGVALVMACLAPAIAWFYGEPRLIAITLALAVSCALSGLVIQHQALMRRAMQFHSLAAIRVTSTVLPQLLGIAWAWNHYGEPDDYWALVVIPLGMSVAGVLGAWIACPWRPGLPRRGMGTRPLVVFGANLSGFNFTNYFNRNADKMLIGWWSGAAPLGFYERAYRLLLFPLQNISTPITSVMLPALSRVAHDRDLLIGTYLRAIRLLLATLVPALIAVAATADWWVMLVLGDAFAESVPIFRWLAIAAVVQPISNSTSWVFLSQDRAEALFRWALLATPITVGSFLAGLAWGPEGVAMGYAIVGLSLRFPMLIWWLNRTGVLEAHHLLKEFRLASPQLVSVGAVNLCLMLLSGITDPAVGVFACVSTTLAATALVIASTAHGRSILAELRTIASLARPGTSS